jgi:hypothetical protein
MDLLKSKNNDRLVIWMGMPPVAASSGVKNVEMLDNIYWSEAQKRPWVKYFDAAPFFTGTDGSFAKSLTSADGSEHVMRANDGVHFSITGGMRMGWAVYAKLGTLVDLSAAPCPSTSPRHRHPPSWSAPRSPRVRVRSDLAGRPRPFGVRAVQAGRALAVAVTGADGSAQASVAPGSRWRLIATTR